MNATTLNGIKHKIHTTDKEGNPLIISIRLDDECKNGHADFAITGSLYTKGKPMNDRNNQACGCIHDIIFDARPELKPFIDLHLSDQNGAPTYAIDNGLYHLKEGKKHLVLEHFRITEDEYNLIAVAEDELHLQYIVEGLNLPARWKAEAEAATAILEGMTGLKYGDTSTRSNFTPLTPEKRAELEERVKSGYYTPEQLQARAEAKEAARRANILAGIEKQAANDIGKAQVELNVKRAVFNTGLELDNFIYYNHTNTGQFNWHTSSFNKAITPEQFEQFLSNVDYSNLPEGIKFKIK